jgi:uncharacterized protein
VTASNIPDAEVVVNGTPLPIGAQADLRAVTVEDDVDALSMFTLELYNWDEEKLVVSWSDSALFAVGNEVRVSLGYVDALSPVMTGEITSLEPVFTADSPPLLTVRGYDHRHRLARGSRTRAFTNMKDSAIAGQIGREAGLRVTAADTKVTLPHVMQSNQSDWDFLRERARRIGYQVRVHDKVLYFQPPATTGRAAATLAVGAELTEFAPRLSALGQVGEVSVRGWDVKAKQAVVGKAATGQEWSAMGGKATGPRAAGTAFGRTSLSTVDDVVRTKAEADSVALGGFNTRALGYVEGSGACAGMPSLRAGTVVDITGAGSRFSGAYYLTSVTHQLAPDEGYRTSFTVRRSGS